MNYKNITVSNEGLIATVTINRPDKLNALNKQVIAELGDCMTQLDNDVEIRCVILTGSVIRLLLRVQTSLSLPSFKR